MSGIELKRERLGNCLEDVRPLMEQHKRLVGGQLDSDACIDWDLFLQLETVGALHLTTGRERGELLGYIFWTLAASGLEYKNTPHAIQGPWFVRPSLRRATLGRDLFLSSLDDLRSRGFHFALPHHWDKGSGKKLAGFFLGLGAVPLEHTYMLDLRKG